MKFSMNGFRRSLSNDVSALRNVAQDIVDGSHWDEEDLIDAVNTLITHSNVINCVSSKTDPDFSEIELEVPHLGEEPE